MITSQHLMPTRFFAQMMALDALLYACLFWRDYSEPGQMLVGHYISFVAISDLAVLFLPREKRHWYNLFRFSSGISHALLIVGLAAKGLNGDSIGFTAFCVLLCLLRSVHALWGLRQYGPGWEEIRRYPGYLADYFRRGNLSERLGCGWLIVAATMIYLPQLWYWMHYNGGQHALDDILTGLNAQNGVNFTLKMLLIETFILAAGARFFMRTLTAALFVVQWPFMLGMFYLAPIPIVHVLGEGFAVFIAVLAWREWRRPHRRTPE